MPKLKEADVNKKRDMGSKGLSINENSARTTKNSHRKRQEKALWLHMLTIFEVRRALMTKFDAKYARGLTVYVVFGLIF